MSACRRGTPVMVCGIAGSMMARSRASSGDRSLSGSGAAAGAGAGGVMRRRTSSSTRERAPWLMPASSQMPRHRLRSVRVLAVGNMYPPHHLGGYELAWQGAVHHLRDRGDEVRVLTTTHREPTEAPDEP